MWVPVGSAPRHVQMHQVPSAHQGDALAMKQLGQNNLCRIWNIKCICDRSSGTPLEAKPLITHF